MCEYNDKIKCNCTFACSKHAKCCDCIAYHLRNDEFPACYFSVFAEKTGDRSLESLIRDRKG